MGTINDFIHGALLMVLFPPYDNHISNDKLVGYSITLNKTNCIGILGTGGYACVCVQYQTALQIRYNTAISSKL